MSNPYLDIACVSSTSYNYTKRPSTRRLPALKGRPRYRLRDTWATYVVDLVWVYTEEQYAQFQTFWYDQINAGADSFDMRLMMDDHSYFTQQQEIYTVHATGGFSSSIDAHLLWTVRLQVEVPGGFRIGQVFCPTIYGGPITDPATDEYYGGPITDLATDIIEPCDGVV